MARFLFWLVYYFELGPLGAPVMDLAVKAWLLGHRARSARPRVARRAMTPAWTLR